MLVDGQRDPFEVADEAGLQTLEHPPQVAERGGSAGGAHAGRHAQEQQCEVPARPRAGRVVDALLQRHPGAVSGIVRGALRPARSASKRASSSRTALHDSASSQAIVAAAGSRSSHSSSAIGSVSPACDERPDLELAQQLVAAGQRLLGGAEREGDVVEEGLVVVRRAELEAHVRAGLAAAEAHPVLGQRLAAVGEDLEVRPPDVHPERVLQRDLRAAVDEVVDAERDRRVGVVAGEVGHLEGAEDVVAGGLAALVALADAVGVRAEDRDVDEVVDAVDRVRHEQRALHVQPAGRLGRHAGDPQAPVVAVTRAGVAEGDLALLGRQRVRVGDAVEVLPRRLGAEHAGRHRAHLVGVVHRDAGPELAELRRDLDALGPQRAGGVAAVDGHVLAVLELHGAPAREAPVRQRLRVGLADAVRGLAGVAGPLDRVAGARVAQRVGVEREEARLQRLVLRCERAPDRLVPAVAKLVAQLVGVTGGVVRHRPRDAISDLRPSRPARAPPAARARRRAGRARGAG